MVNEKWKQADYQEEEEELLTFLPIPHLLDSKYAYTSLLESTQTSLSGFLQQLPSGCKYKHTSLCISLEQKQTQFQISSVEN